MYIYTYTVYVIQHTILQPLHGNSALGSFGWHYLSNATCLRWPLWLKYIYIYIYIYVCIERERERSCNVYTYIYIYIYVCMFYFVISLTSTRSHHCYERIFLCYHITIDYLLITNYCIMRLWLSITILFLITNYYIMLCAILRVKDRHNLLNHSPLLNHSALPVCIVDLICLLLGVYIYIYIHTL